MKEILRKTQVYSQRPLHSPRTHSQGPRRYMHSILSL